MESESQFQQLGEHAAAIRAVSFSKEGNILYSASDDNTVRIWNISQGVANLSPVSTLRGHGGWVRSCVAAGDDDKHVLSGSYDGQVFLWNWREYAFPRVLRRAPKAPSATFDTLRPPHRPTPNGLRRPRRTAK